MALDRSPLGAFLRSRRDGLSPARAGVVTFPGPRRVPGLRKEELALIAGLSPDHYSRIEQGRQRNVTDDVVEALCRALQLDTLEAAHLRHLAAPSTKRRAAASDPFPRIDPGMARLMVTLDHVPTLLLGRRSEILASNGLLREVLGWEATSGTSFIRWLFRDPAARDRITNWADFAAAAIGSIRYEAGRRPEDQDLIQLINELRENDEDAERWWNDQRVSFRTSLEKHVRHDVAGSLSFNIESVISPQDPDQRLVVYTVEAGSHTAHMLPVLATWATVPAQTSVLNAD
ncbi:helix-turn-helix domain-containing protein [Nesterenkonia haasae]|uniref:helix-turn-helix domain-containing protein n=1 Tax=Nesterenkonia haasae TaxID=2587813 RepID=UPI0013907402|nr:helix-turn-helix transcriptional regulator [Nesterenkonia haasae]NDK31806.1 helix-turn-helix domain-containing protein [Nesterenkonia haasae]